MTKKLSKKAIVKLLLDYENAKNQADAMKAEIDRLVADGVIISDIQLTDTLICKYTPASTTTRLDNKMVQANYPDIYEKCLKEYSRKPFVAIKPCKPKTLV